MQNCCVGRNLHLHLNTISTNLSRFKYSFPKLTYYQYLIVLSFMQTKKLGYA